MADSQQSIDWNTIGNAALECVNAACSLAHWAERSQEDDYNAENAALHLAAIDSACETLGRAIALFDPQYFNKIVLASVGEGARPDFRFGEACYSTAHQAALELLRAGVLHIEIGLNEIAPDNYVAGIDDLHALSPDDLRDSLIDVFARPVSLWAVKEIEFAQVKQFQAWIHREWAAVSRYAKPHVLDLSDTPKEQRDKWIYEECRNLTPYQTIALKLKKKPKKLKWPIIESVNGVKMAAERYAKRHNLPKPPARQSGRLPG